MDDLKNVKHICLLQINGMLLKYIGALRSDICFKIHHKHFILRVLCYKLCLVWSYR